MQNYHTLRLILGDQLNGNHSWYKQTDDETLYVFMEMQQETGYVRHHIQKVVGFFLAMRNFSDDLKKQGHSVHYLTLDDEQNTQSLTDNLSKIIEERKIQKFEYQLPDEYRLDQQLQHFCKELSIETEAFDTEHFLTERLFVEEFFEGKKTYLMESFYRHMRKKYDIMMEDDGESPLTGKWNYDAANRKKLPKKVAIPEKKPFSRNVEELVQMLEAAEVATIGTIEADDFNWPVTRKEIDDLLDHFFETSLAQFGTYQDAMTVRDDLLFHSRISFGLNTKMISPLEVVQRSVAYWEQHQGEIDIAQIEGFVRQIIGWREYMRGVYWAKMPEYEQLNYFDHDTPLPEFYWTGKTDMKCLQSAIGQSLETAYAHHIQRLMVTGNFALLLGCDPDEVDEWYLGIYMDAVQWVEITNTRGMSQFADGGIVGTKPYISSANYMHKMSDYCSNCKYDRKAKTGKDACPYNSLYWEFYLRHEDKLRSNARVSMMYRLLDKMDSEDKAAMLERAQWIREHINEL